MLPSDLNEDDWSRRTWMILDAPSNMVLGLFVPHLFTCLSLEASGRNEKKIDTLYNDILASNREAALSAMPRHGGPLS